MSGDTNTMMQAYENIFGPAARDIKLDTQRHKRHQRWHLPDALKGASPFLTDRVDGLITDATSSPFTKNILPYMYFENPDRKIKWNVYSFDEGIASRVPYESAARVLPQSKRSFAGYAMRQGLAIAMEHNFMMSAAGMGTEAIEHHRGRPRVPERGFCRTWLAAWSPRVAEARHS